MVLMAVVLLAQKICSAGLCYFTSSQCCGSFFVGAGTGFPISSRWDKLQVSLIRRIPAVFDMFLINSILFLLLDYDLELNLELQSTKKDHNTTVVLVEAGRGIAGC